MSIAITMSVSIQFLLMVKIGIFIDIDEVFSSN